MTRLSFHDSTLTQHGPHQGTLPAIPAGTPLVELASLFARHDCHYTLVHNDRGRLIGAVSAADLQAAMRQDYDEHTAAWHQRTVESLLRVVIDTESVPADNPSGAVPHGKALPEPCLSVRQGSRLVGVMTQNDLLLSWNHLEPALASASLDALTQLPNRAHFERRLAEEWQRAARLNLTLGLILIDVDHFKEINDTHGHPVGDRVLAAVADCCQRQLRTYDLVARYAGDEFVALTCGCHVDDIDLPIRRLQDSIRSVAIRAGGQPVDIRLSIGAAVCGPELTGVMPQTLVQAADQCLYAAKRSGRNRSLRTEILADGALSEFVPVEAAAAAAP